MSNERLVKSVSLSSKKLDFFNHIESNRSSLIDGLRDREMKIRKVERLHFMVQLVSDIDQIYDSTVPLTINVVAIETNKTHETALRDSHCDDGNDYVFVFYRKSLIKKFKL